MGLLLLLTGWVDGQVALLGADSFEVRERASARLNHPVAALFTPAWHDDPEINYRLRSLRTANLRYLNPRYVEQRIYRTDYNAWLRLYLFTGRSGICEEWDTFADIHRDTHKSIAVFRVWEPADLHTEFLCGDILPGEFEVWLRFLDYHRGIAPMPRESTPVP